MKAPDMSYELFAKVFASVYRKHAKVIHRSLFTCYVRDALENYLEASPERRGGLLENGSGEDAIGYRIGKALVATGWAVTAALDHRFTMQRRVDDADGHEELSFTDQVYDKLGRPDKELLCHDGNNLRLHWLMCGAPDLISG